jgi:hypothetical protein
MATITPTITNPPRLRSKLFNWALTGSATSDVGVAADVLGYSAALLTSLYTSGGTTTLTWEGSHDGTNFFVLVAAAVPTANTVAVSIPTLPRYVRPKLTGTSALVVSAQLLAR